ncbi:MAG: ComF family protein [Paludibacteraceae bacterium]|nr:ComF family protein [Paludibacteraceae bacterium]MBN2787351.1 ComF family protein [Paludibacteraceae bacterium]
MTIRSIIDDVIHLLFPNNCLVCGENLIRGEELICFSCLHKIPKTNNHLITETETDKRFWGKVRIEKAVAFYTFQKGSSIQKLLHELKYRGRKDVGQMLGKKIAIELQQHATYNTIDVIIPVPLHKKRLKKRGYNQSECFANGLSEVLNKPVDNTSLFRAIENPTQTKKGVYERFENTQGIFELANPNAIKDKHILLVDDVMTTGSTLEACAQVLLKAEGTKVSILTIAVA